MVKPRWNRNEVLRSAPSMEIWPTVSEELIPEDLRERFRSKCRAVKMYIEGESCVNIEKTTGVQRNAIQSITAKCLDISTDGHIFGFRALIPFQHRRDYTRHSAISRKYNEAHGGLSGALRCTLNRFPEIESDLIKLIQKKKSAKHNVHERRIRTSDLHRFFINQLKQAGIKDNEWPFNTKHRGLKSIAKYMKSILDASFGRSVFTREEQPSIAHIAVGAGHKPFISFDEPYDAVELDAYAINAFFSAAFQTPINTSVDVQLDRLWLIALIEKVTRAILAYSVVYRSEVSAEDVIEVIRKAINSPIVPELTIPGLSYPQGGGFPSEIFPQCNGAVWSAMLLDGALAHLSEAVRERARKELGFALNWGPVAHFERRPDIERFFKRISDDVFMRYPSTTGSNPGKGRAKNAEDNAVIYKLRADEAEQLIAVYVAQHNATPSQGTFYLSPLDVMKHFIEEKGDHFLIRHLPNQHELGRKVLSLQRECVIRGGRSSGRRPYIQIDSVRYTNPVLAQSALLIGKKLLVEIDVEDMRFVRAYLPNGAELGHLKAGGKWGITKHSRITRLIINRLITKKTLVITSYDDPIQVYLNYLSSQHKKTRSKRKVITPSKATEATRVSKESGLPRVLTVEAPTPMPQASTPLHQQAKQANLMPTPMPNLNTLLKK